MTTLAELQRKRKHLEAVYHALENLTFNVIEYGLSGVYAKCLEETGRDLDRLDIEEMKAKDKVTKDDWFDYATNLARATR